MEIAVLLPYDEAPRHYKKWANEENSVCFENPQEAKRCTISFAAEELCTYLDKISLKAKVSDSYGEFNIILDCEEKDSEEFDIDF